MASSGNHTTERVGFVYPSKAVEALFGDEARNGIRGNCTDVMGEPLTEDDAWMPGFVISAHLGVRIAAEMSQSGC
jgi:hypothetical protein